MSAEVRPVALRVDIVSDIVCPWCVIGYYQLLKALEGLPADLQWEIHWHPFELNPAMPEAGQNLHEHLGQKYGSTPEQGRAARARLAAMGESMGFQFNYHDDMRMVNTFRAHQLMDWAGEQGRQTELALELFAAFFSRCEDLNDVQVLVAAAASVGLLESEAQQLLDSGAREVRVREEESHWLDRGVYAVPTLFINDRFPLTGAQEAAQLHKKLLRVLEAA